MAAPQQRSAARTSAQQRDARELAKTPLADPYRGSLADPYNVTITTPATARAGDSAHVPDSTLTIPGPTTARSTTATNGPAQQPLVRARARQQGTPTPATLAGIIAIALGVALALLAMVLLAILGLQDDYGAPDRSFYRGTDSGYVVMALVNFGLALASSLGGLALLTGRLVGRIAVTAAAVGVLVLSGFWWLRGDVTAGVPIVIGLLAVAMLGLCYQRSVSSWLGVLPAPQPE